jgi:hypothetical protein
MPTYQLEGGGELHLDYDAVGALLRSSAMQGLMADAYTTDRGAASVTIAVRGGDDAELKYGILSDAALQVGLEYAQKGG